MSNKQSRCLLLLAVLFSSIRRTRSSFVIFRLCRCRHHHDNAGVRETIAQLMIQDVKVMDRKNAQRSDESTANFSVREKHKTALFLAGDSGRGEEEEAEEQATTRRMIFGVPRDTVAAPLALLLLSQFILFIGVGAVIPSIPLYGKEIGLSSSMNGVVISAPAVALLLGAKRGGNFADRGGRRPAMLLGMAVIALADVGTALATGLTTLILARLGLGAGRCLAEAGERGMLADIASRAPELRGRALAAQQAALALGIAIGAPLGGIIVERYGPRASFLCVSAAAIVTLVLYLFLPETVTTSENDVNQDITTSKMTILEAQALNRKKQESVISQGEWTKLLTMNQWRGLALCQCGASFGFAAKIASIPILATAVLPGGAAGAGALLSVAGLSGIVGAPIGGFLSDRTSAKLTAILSGIVSAAGLILVPLALSDSSSSSLLSFLDSGNGSVNLQLPFIGGIEMTNQAVAFSVVVIAWSLGASAQGPAMTAVAQQLAPKGAEATAMALPRATGDGTYIAAPFLLGLVTDSIVSMPGAECACAGAATLLGTLAFALLGDNDHDPKQFTKYATGTTESETTLARSRPP
jgi:MFS family permease